MWGQTRVKKSREPKLSVVATHGSPIRLRIGISCDAMRPSVRQAGCLYGLSRGLSREYSMAMILSLVPLLGCGASEIKPVDIFPEDMCAHCRMAVSDQRFAAEIISDAREPFKFDDIGCMEDFQKENSNLKIAARFFKDYETKNWIVPERATIVETSVFTPMGSGKVAFADSSKAKEFLRQHPQ